VPLSPRLPFEPAPLLAVLFPSLSLFASSFPYGGVVAVPAAFAWAAAIATFWLFVGCRLIESRWIEDRSGNILTVGMGPWLVQKWDVNELYSDGNVVYSTSTGCIGYTMWYGDIDLSDNFDATAKTAQAFSMMALVLGIILVVLVSLPCCCALRRKGFVFVGFACALNAFNSLMTLVMRGSASVCNRDLGCNYGWTAWLAVGTGVAWLGIGLAMCALSGTEERARPALPGPPLPPAAAQPACVAYPAAAAGLEAGPVGAKLERTEETSRIPNPDGTVTVVHRSITHNQDGSKSVTETSHVENGQPLFDASVY
jgi:hypothetical protein